MKEKSISATQFRKNLSKILDEVYFKKMEVIVERYGKPTARIKPLKEERAKQEQLNFFTAIQSNAK